MNPGRCVLLLCAFVSMSCGGSPTAVEQPSTTTSTATSSSTTTTTIASASAHHYVGALALSPPAPPAVLDLSLFFNLPGGALRVGRARPLAVYQVIGGYNTGPGGFTGSITGTLDGTLESGTFSGVITARLAGGCVARRQYAGPVTRQAVNWTAGAHLDTCGGATPLLADISLPAVTSPPTTSVESTTISSTTTAGTSSISTTTSVPTSTTTTSSTSTSSTSSSTTTSSVSTTTTTVTPLTASYMPLDPECVMNTISEGCTYIGSASGNLPPYTYDWIFRNESGSAQVTRTGEKVTPTFGCSFSPAGNFTVFVTLTVTSSTGAKAVVTGSNRVDRSFIPVCPF